MSTSLNSNINVLYVYDRLTNTNVPNKIGVRLSAYGAVRYSAIALSSPVSFLKCFALILRADVVHTHHTKSALYVSFLLLILKIANSSVIRIHTAHRDLTTLSKVSVFIYRIFILPLSSVVVCNSRSTEVKVSSLHNKKKSRVIYNGIDVDLFHPRPSSIAGKNNIVAVGRLIPIKNHRCLIEAVGKCVSEGHDIKLTIAGSGPCGEALKAQIESLGLQSHVQMVGEIPYQEVPNLLRSSATFVSASFSEGFGNSTIEAALCGLRILASDIPVHREISGGYFGLFDPNSVEDLASLIASVTDRRADIESSTQINYFTRFSEEICAQKHLELYSDLVNEINNPV